MKTKPDPIASRDDRDFLRAFGVAVKDARRRNGWTQEDLSVRAASTAEWISQIERGVGTPSITTLLRLAEGLGVEPAALVEAATAGSRGRLDLAPLVGEAQHLPREGVEALVELARAMRKLTDR